MDWTQIVTAVITLIGVWVMNSKQLAVIQEQNNQLRSEKQKHNRVIERTYKLEETTALHEAESNRQGKRIDELEKEVKP